MEDKSIKKIIAKSEYEKGKAFLKELEEVKISSKRNYFIAASIIVLLGLSIVTIFINTNSNEQDLFAQNFEPYDNVIVPISRSETAESMIERAFYYYESQDYDNALLVIDSLLSEENKLSFKLKFYKANIFLQQDKNLTKAIGILENNVNASNEWKDKNLWYLSLAYLKAGNKEKASKLLQELEELQSNFKTTKRSVLLKALE